METLFVCLVQEYLLALFLCFAVSRLFWHTVGFVFGASVSLERICRVLPECGRWSCCLCSHRGVVPGVASSESVQAVDGVGVSANASFRASEG